VTAIELASVPPSTRTEVDFRSQDSLCRGWLYRPTGAENIPCIVMAHGLGGTRELGLAAYAERFVAAGYAVLVFDYRGFGSSDGMPRQLVSVRRQLRDWQAAIDFARRLSFVDPQSIALWGSSFSGGHVLRVAVDDGRVRAVSAQCPMMDGLASSLGVVRYGGLLYALRLVAHGLWDLLVSLAGRDHLIPLAARPGEVAAMSTTDALPGLRALSSRSFNNTVSARIAVTLAAYRPGRVARKMPCPILIQICEHDTVAPPSAAEAAARRAGALATVVRYEMGHFDPYVGVGFDRSVRDQLAFFDRHLRAAVSPQSVR
jgi:dienelactone hydrolase